MFKRYKSGETGMETVKCIKERRSIRNFEDRKIERKVIEEIVEAAAYAPSWKNSQITRYIVVEDREIIDKIADECVLGFEHNTKTLKKAAALVIVNVVTGRSGFERDGSYSTPKGDRWQNFDAGIACQTFCLAAHDKGIGTVIMGIFDEYKVAEIVNIPAGQRIEAFIAMGYPQGDIPQAPKRKQIEELVSYV